MLLEAARSKDPGPALEMLLRWRRCPTKLVSLRPDQNHKEVESDQYAYVIWAAFAALAASFAIRSRWLLITTISAAMVLFNRRRQTKLQRDELEPLPTVSTPMIPSRQIIATAVENPSFSYFREGTVRRLIRKLNINPDPGIVYAVVPLSWDLAKEYAAEVEEEIFIDKAVLAFLRPGRNRWHDISSIRMEDEPLDLPSIIKLMKEMDKARMRSKLRITPPLVRHLFRPTYGYYSYDKEVTEFLHYLVGQSNIFITTEAASCLTHICGLGALLSKLGGKLTQQTCFAVLCRFEQGQYPTSRRYNEPNGCEEHFKDLEPRFSVPLGWHSKWWEPSWEPSWRRQKKHRERKWDKRMVARADTNVYDVTQWLLERQFNVRAVLDSSSSTFLEAFVNASFPSGDSDEPLPSRYVTPGLDQDLFIALSGERVGDPRAGCCNRRFMCAMMRYSNATTPSSNFGSGQIDFKWIEMREYLDVSETGTTALRRFSDEKQCRLAAASYSLRYLLHTHRGDSEADNEDFRTVIKLVVQNFDVLGVYNSSSLRYPKLPKELYIEALKNRAENAAEILKGVLELDENWVPNDEHFITAATHNALEIFKVLQQHNRTFYNRDRHFVTQEKVEWSSAALVAVLKDKQRGGTKQKEFIQYFRAEVRSRMGLTIAWNFDVLLELTKEADIANFHNGDEVDDLADLIEDWKEEIEQAMRAISGEIERQFTFEDDVESEVGEWGESDEEEEDKEVEQEEEATRPLGDEGSSDCESGLYLAQPVG
ncbi:hypothetical protein B0T14DRAFT_572011 [Immersiella caudata]|uniref:Uncharacterized protein n=1 Tax=Immersiella caudata TaxID=314043 RepID=A0AA39WBF9_9PEZI|nr:hypothetical protein B0T14DRAFT_572011 [Immersiella caudata]